MAYFTWKTEIGSLFRIPLCCQVHERSGERGWVLFLPLHLWRQPLKRISRVPWHTVWELLPHFLLCAWSSDSELLRWMAEFDIRGWEREQTFLSSFILSPTHMSHSYFSLFLSPNVLHSSIFSPLQSYGKVQTVGLEDHTRYSRRVILTTHKMMFWEGKPIVRFLVNILDWHRIWGCLALVYIPSLYILSPLFAFIRAYNHGKHCNYLS